MESTYFDDRGRALARRLYRSMTFDHLFSRRAAEATAPSAAREALSARLWAGAPFERQAPGAVPELGPDEATFPRLLDLSEGFRRPVVLRGFARHTAAVRSWSEAHLRARLGSTPCTVVEMAPAIKGQPDVARRALHQLPFEVFLRRMHDEPLYLHNNTQLATAHPALLDDLGLDALNARLCDPGSGWDHIFASNFFIGTQNVFSNLHCAPGGNFFMQIAGRKTWTLIDPQLTPYLAPRMARPFNFCLSGYGAYHVQTDDSPLWRLPRAQVTLEPGDVLYNAPWWWHEVVNEGVTIGCALRHLTSPFGRSPTWSNHPLFSALSGYPRLWALSAVDYARHRLGAGGSAMRATVNPRLSAALNRARGRS